MWSQFFVAVFAGALLLYVPGYLAMRAGRFCRLVAIGSAPAVSLLGYEICAIVLAKAGIWASGASVSIPVIVASALLLALSAALARKRLAKREGDDAFSIGSRLLPDGKTQAVSLVAFAAFALVVVMVVFVKSLDGPSSYFQAYDNLSHMGRIKVFVETGWFAPFGTDFYYDLGQGAPSVSRSSAFYPSSWNCLGAMLVSMLDVPIPMSVNVVNCLFMALVYPTNACLLINVLFRRYARFIPAFSVLCLAFAAFPWGMLNFGPLFPNLAAYALAPSVAALFIGCFEAPRRQVPACIAAFAVLLLSLALSHPNAVFLLAVFLAPYLVYRVHDMVAASALGREHRFAALVAAIVMTVAIAVVWVMLYYAPPFASVTSYHGWHAFASKRQALVNVVLLSLRDTPAQFVLGALVMAGVLYTLRRRQHLWMSCSFGIASVMYAVNATTDGYLKSLLTGFWYTDSYRVCAVLAMVALPLACLGMVAVVRAFQHVTRILCEGLKKPVTARAISVAFMAIVVLGIYYPSFDVIGAGTVETAFGYVEHETFYHNDTKRLDDSLNADERAFLEQVKREVPEGALILNQPYDGSAFAYATMDMNVYYRYLGNMYNRPSSESPVSQAIRQKLCYVDEDDEVRDAVETTGAEYLLMLDYHDQDDKKNRRWLITYEKENWTGINRIKDDTPGFEVVLKSGDMRLYRITAVNDVQ